MKLPFIVAPVDLRMSALNQVSGNAVQVRSINQNGYVRTYCSRKASLPWKPRRGTRPNIHDYQFAHYHIGWHYSSRSLLQILSLGNYNHFFTHHIPSLPNKEKKIYIYFMEKYVDLFIPELVFSLGAIEQCGMLTILDP